MVSKFCRDVDAVLITEAGPIVTTVTWWGGGGNVGAGTITVVWWVGADGVAGEYTCGVKKQNTDGKISAEQKK